ncbi:1,3-beta-glucan synthase [Ascoidea rubescens DSM 1968]|uniref:1,3-beta-glucan synthase n=1 Tax=Ascoidea rubescens DSM 1968 TaxID=1344418 RepID=A0A1D2VEX0_9ASCO|nr:glycosyltransferase family 48 protein [Ascoidea rubescens DSM 1968]ODV60201.1 glycosyltransferase family 48 protein [Ascoidea rubescens DSM 1968]
MIPTSQQKFPSISESEIKKTFVTEEHPNHRYPSTTYPVQQKELPTHKNNYDPNQINQTVIDYDDPFPTLNDENLLPVPLTKVESIFNDITKKLGFQTGNCKNMLNHFLMLWDSRSSRIDSKTALISIHADFIGGTNANFRKWYFASMLEFDGLEDLILPDYDNPKEPPTAPVEPSADLKFNISDININSIDLIESEIKFQKLKELEYRWRLRMNLYSYEDYITQIAVYLLVWGEANQIRFMPECLCFLYKLSYDYYISNLCKESEPLKEYYFLSQIITPIYKFLRDQVYKINPENGKFIRREKDHNKIIGYDDVNQLFWYKGGLERIKIVGDEKTKLMSLSKETRFLNLHQVKWNKVFYKTYWETRTWAHVLTNFNRIWIIHFCMFWFYTSFNSPTLYTKNYDQTANNQPTAQATLSVVSLGGTIACILELIATIAELFFVPRQWPGAQSVFNRILFITFMLIVNITPSIYVLGMIPVDVYSKVAFVISIIQFIIAIITYFVFSIRPLGGLFSSYLFDKKKPLQYYASREFTAAFPKLTGRGRWFSYLLWISVFGAKFTESYFFLTLSLRDPIRNLSIMEMTRCVGDIWLGSFLCRQQARIVLFLMYLADLVLFFLDTYLWYIICNCFFSVGLSFNLGISILSPWKNIYVRLPKRIYTKILATKDMEVKYKPKVLVSQVWNAIIISMYREHLLPLENVERLLYHQQPSENLNKRTLKTPTFFVSEDDKKVNTDEFFPARSEASRRLSYFAQSLSTTLPETLSIAAMPTFTVLIPHYGEKILLSLKEIIREDKNSKISLLEYLKRLHPVEWECFVKDTKVLCDMGEKTEPTYTPVSALSEKDLIKRKINDVPFYCIGFKDANPEFTLRTRIWASLRSQTLYRTISGFMNYQKALKLLYRVENPELIEEFTFAIRNIDEELRKMACRKFRIVVSMQRYKSFNEEEAQAASFLLGAYPDLYISYLEEVKPETADDEVEFYSVLINGYCGMDNQGNVIPIYRIKLSGNPILGDGKSDNQNHSIIFYRGEYIQVIDANQDNYLEECLKIRAVLAEFEEYDFPVKNPYNRFEAYETKNPVAIIGAREYIFSENSGALGDVAAGKEQTFGTLFARTLAEIGGKLHYGHPDFLNAIFMTTRGGISKAQKSLHLNEDIYAGMTAICRGGRIKHCDYFQCGKGRDLGFGSILNFTTKIGAGMGEQMLSREYYYLGTQLPIDRFLSFYYAHPGFHINNMFIILSMQLFLLVVLNLGSLSNESILCMYDKNVPITDLQLPIGCYNIQPVLDWVTIFILSIFICFFISFLPLLLQELTERGVWRAWTRFFHHLISLSPLFEVFVCQIYAKALITNVTFGGAQYISTGRGFATTRNPFHVLYSRFTVTSIYSGALLFLGLLFGSITMWQPALLWFWLTMISMCLAPFIFNPHQFCWSDFFVDYGQYIRWLSRGNSKWHQNSWIGYIRSTRGKYTGYKKKEIGVESEKEATKIIKAKKRNTFFGEVFVPSIFLIFTFFGYSFVNSQNGVKDTSPTNCVLRLLIVTFSPIVVNMAVLLIVFVISCTLGTLCNMFFKKTAAVAAAIVHGISVVAHIFSWEVLWYLEGMNFSRTLIGFICCCCLQKVCMHFFIILFLTREFKFDDVNNAWWTGNWYRKSLGWTAPISPFREFFVKTIEATLFARDFVLGHCLLFIQLPLVMIPWTDTVHSVLLFWLKAGDFKSPILTKRGKKKISKTVTRYSILYFTILCIFLALFIVPVFMARFVPDFSKHLPSDIAIGLFQPFGQDNNDTGPINAPETIPRGKPVASILSEN